jgi:hypothetical protein
MSDRHNSGMQKDQSFRIPRWSASQLFAFADMLAC